jgi:hypothetical protein
MRHNNIVSAIEWLPEHLFTEEIVEAAVESKEIEVLSHIPGRFLTPGRIERIIAGSTESWHSFELRNIPEAYRSGAVCSLRNSPLSKAKSVTLPRSLRMMILLTTEPSAYCTFSVMLNFSAVGNALLPATFEEEFTADLSN